MNQDELMGLVFDLLAERIGEKDFERLSHELRHNEASRLRYIEMMALHSDLSTEGSSDDDQDSERLETVLDEILANPIHVPAPIESNSNWGVASTWIPYVGLTLALTFCGWLIYEGFGSGVGNHGGGFVSRISMDTDESAEPYKTAVAQLSRIVDVNWSKDQTKFKQDSVVDPCTLEFESGLVQVEFFCGATMILEGPAKFDILGPKSGFIYHGSLRVSVPEQAIGFTVGSNTVDVEDLGTEFGMNIGDNGKAEVHVLDGEVRVKAPQSESGIATTALAERLLKTGEGIRISGSGESDSIESDRNKFVGPKKLFETLSASKLKGFERWQQSINTLTQDPAVEALYSFEANSDNEAWDRTLFDIAGSAANGAIVGSRWTEGRWKHKRGLQFSTPGDRVRVDVPGVFDALTMSTWVKLDGLGFHHPKSKIALLHPHRAQSNYVHWTLDVSNDKAYLHLAVTECDLDAVDLVDQRENRVHYPSLISVVDKDSLGKWMHLAVTYDPVNKLVNHYCDGELVRAVEIEQIQKIGVGRANIGNWPYQEWAKGTAFEVRNIQGIVDEFVIASRVFSKDEIRLLYEAGSK